MSQFRITFDGVDCLVSLSDLPEGVSWRARIMRRCSVTREITGLFRTSEIASSLSISPRTVECHRQALLRLFGVHNSIALRSLIIPTEDLTSLTAAGYLLKCLAAGESPRRAMRSTNAITDILPPQ